MILQMLIADHEDLLIKILLCLPAKSLVRFKLVCKRWLSLICTHHFSHQHTLHHHDHIRRSRPQPSLLLHLSETSNYFHLQQCPYGEKWAVYDFAPSLKEPTIWNFSNGLFLLNCRNVDILNGCHVYNPTSKESRKISLNRNDSYRCILGLNIVFDPSKSPYYKIVCVKARPRRSSLFWRSWWQRCQIEVYKSDTDTWKLSGEPFLAPSDLKFDFGVHSNGSIHWHGIFFDLNDNVVGKHPEIVFPEDFRTEIVWDHYIESKGFMHYIAHFPEKKSLMVFELLSDYSEWLLKYHISLDKYDGPLSVLSIYRGESEDESAIVLHQPGKVMTHNFKGNCLKEVVDFREKSFYQEHRIQFSSRCSFQFIETLAPV